MQQIKKTADYTVYQKKSGRYAVMDKGKKWVNGDDKTRILLAETLIKLPEPKAPEPQVETNDDSPAAAEATSTEEQPES